VVLLALETSPAGQVWHASAPLTLENLPASQLVHKAAPKSEVLPASQREQVEALEALNLPFGQSQHWLMPSTGPYLPAAQSEHDETPSPGALSAFPAGHGTHVVDVE
jgi:hypothetical protein